MAKSSRKRRDAVAIPRRSLPRSVSRKIGVAKRLTWREYEDRRQYHPLQKAAPAHTTKARRASLTLVQRPKARVQMVNPFGLVVTVPAWPSQTKSSVAFARPDRVLICMRRQERKEVLHALKKTGKIGQQAPKRNWMSQISCRRS